MVAYDAHEFAQDCFIAPSPPCGAPEATMYLSQNRYRVHDLPWEVSSPGKASPPAAADHRSVVVTQALRRVDRPERDTFLSDSFGGLQRATISTARMRSCIVTRELRQIRSCQPLKATRLCSLAELSSEPSEPSSSLQLLTYDPAEVSTSTSTRPPNGDTGGPLSGLLPSFQKGVITDEEVKMLRIDPRRLQWFLNSASGPRHGHGVGRPSSPVKPLSRKRKRPHRNHPTTHAHVEGIPLIPSAKLLVESGAIVPATNGYRVLERLPPVDLSGQCVLLLGMVYANEARRQCDGQGMRDTERIVALEKQFDCRVFTVDKTHPERVGYVASDGPRHIQGNFNDPRRMLSSFQEAWGKEGHHQFCLIALDYFRSPAGWSETNWSKAFFDHTLPAFCTEGWMLPDNGRLILPNTTCTMEGIRASDALQACFNIAALQDPDDNPLWAATGALEADGTLYDMTGHYTNDTERRHLDEVAPFIQLTPKHGMCGSKMKS